MKNYLILFVIVGLLFAVMFTAVTPLPGGMVIFFLVGTSSLVTIIAVVMLREMTKKMWPVRLRLWEKRQDDIIITEETRAKRVRKKNEDVDYYETISGRLIKAPQPENIIRGEKGSFVDLVITDRMVLPYRPELKIDEDGKDGKAKFKIIPEDQRVWLSNQIEGNVKVTTPTPSKWMMAMPIISVLAAVGVLIGLFIIAADVYPKYMDEMSQNLRTERARTQQLTNEFNDDVDRLVNAVERLSGRSQEPGPPPPPF